MPNLMGVREGPHAGAKFDEGEEGPYSGAKFKPDLFKFKFFSVIVLHKMANELRGRKTRFNVL